MSHATTLAGAAMQGRWQRAELAERLVGTGLLGPVAAEELALRLLDLSPRWPHGTVAELAHLLTELPDLDPPPVSVSPPAPQWQAGVPQWSNAEELATALDLDLGELSWFADIRGWSRHSGQPLRHYRARWLATRSGRWRLIEAPKPRLAEIQRRLSRGVLAKLPLHDAAHGFRPGHSVATFAAPHAGQDLVVRLDLEGFFATVSLPRVHGLLREVGYPPAVARLLAGLLTTSTPVDVVSAAPGSTDWPLRRKLAIAHLPQGAPSSPAVANLVAHRLDRRLAGLAERLGANYTRYADDLAFSGPATLPLHRLVPGVRRIAADEGFRLREDKTRIAAAHQRQRLAGLVVNVAPAVSRTEYETLRAVLHNCLRTGPADQNRAGHPDFRAHLRGRIAWIAATHPARGERLLEMWQRISW
ncbi:MAG TPA: reverse transcriptase family protein [Pseudonocardiaceae bacterium]|nr:reverse transcriptase family protein [Pseudonocardiaceae bacterium]